MMIPDHSNHTLDILDSWFPDKDSCRWVLATIVQVKGSAYRKAGAIMLISERGDTLGLLSGGCLESDLARQARRFLSTLDEDSATIKPKDSELRVPAEQLRYDSQDEDDMLFKLGLGCGGVVDILLQPVEKANGYLALDDVRQTLGAGSGVHYTQHCESIGEATLRPLQDRAKMRFFSTNKLRSGERIASDEQFFQHEPAQQLKIQGKLKVESNSFTLDSWFPRKPRLGIFGGGIDATPLARIADFIGWHVVVHDSRPSHARPEQFSFGDPTSKIKLLKTPLPKKLGQNETILSTIDAAVIMYHSTELDAQAVYALSQLPLRYCALLGPPHRKRQVLEIAALKEKDLPFALLGPAGFRIGAQLPESIALSILSQCHSVLFDGEAGDLRVSDG